jgi:hypothetical protein
VLGLGDEIRSDEDGIGGVVGEDHALGRAGRQVDADEAGDLELGRRHPGVARSDDPIDGREGRCRVWQPEGESADGLGAARNEQGIDLEQAGGAEEDRIEHAIAVRGRCDDHLRDPGDAGRHDGHDQRRWIRGRAAGDVTADPVEGQPAPFDLDPGGDRGGGRDRSLPGGERGDVLDRLIEGAAGGGVEPVARRAQLRAFNDQATVGERAAKSSPGIDDGGQPAIPDVIEDRAGAGPHRVVWHGAAPAECGPLEDVGRVRRRQVEAPDP